ncbi:unnamed protein product [Dicrocoelium dendriticum]|nr:unnamed protein product [Dicrocoelium dendriticum]
MLGTDAYACVCKGNYAPLLTVPRPNCLAYRHICDAADQRNDTISLLPYRKMSSISCFNGGQCISSADGSHARCLCRKNSLNEPLHTGKYCEKNIGIWSSWSAPSPCFPTRCGRIRYKWRRRRCLNASDPATWTSASKWDLLNDHNHDGIVVPEVRCAGTSEEVLPCSELDECKTLRLPSRMREEIIDYKTLFYFLLITGIQIFISAVALCIAQNT